MHIQVNGRQIDVGDALRTHVEERFGTAINKYSENPIDCVVTFSRDRHEMVCDVTAHLSTGLTAKAKAKANDIYAACEGACERVEKQLRRYKRRLKDHHRERAEPVELFGASSYILAASEAESESEPDSLQPIIVAEMETQVPSLSVGEAVMQMELAGAPVLVFRKEGKETVNVVYRREDGNIGWIDP